MRGTLNVIARGTLIGFLAFAGIAHATVINVEPDSFADGTDISNAYAGITLSTVSASGSWATSSAVFARTATQTTASTGSMVFGNDGAGVLNELWREHTLLRADFASAASSVSIDFIADDAADTGILEVYSSLNVLLASLSTGSLGPAGDFGTLTYSGAGIAYIVARGLDGSSALLIDNLSVTAMVPAPATLMLAGFGLVCAMRARRARG
jgi:hypothetical protein